MTMTLTDFDHPSAYSGWNLLSDDDWTHTRVSFPQCLPCIKEKTRALAALPADWDGYGARPIAPAMIEAVCRFLNRLAEQHGELMLLPGTETDCLIPHCGARSSGTVQLEWHVEDRILELEFEKPTEIRYLKWWPGHELTDEEESYPADDMAQSASLIRWVLSGDDAPAE